MCGGFLEARRHETRRKIPEAATSAEVPPETGPATVVLALDYDPAVDPAALVVEDPGAGILPEPPFTLTLDNGPPATVLTVTEVAPGGPPGTLELTVTPVNTPLPAAKVHRVLDAQLGTKWRERF